MDRLDAFKDAQTDIMDSFIKQPNKEQTKEIDTKVSKAMTGIYQNVIDPMINGYKYKNGIDRKHNFITTFKVDADLERYLINIANITLIDAVNNDNADFCTTIQDYLNNLIRADLKKRFKIPPKEQDSKKWIDVVNEYCNKYNMQDVKPIDPIQLQNYLAKKHKK